MLDRSLATDLLMQAAGYETSSDDRVYAEKIVKALESHTLAVILAGGGTMLGMGQGTYLNWTRAPLRFWRARILVWLKRGRSVATELRNRDAPDRATCPPDTTT